MSLMNSSVIRKIGVDMGTRCLTFVEDGLGRRVVCMYRQFDGYPSGHGMELAKFLSPFTIVNGIGGDARYGKVANGAGCLAAQMVQKFKDSVGGFYLYPTDTTDAWQDYEYHVRACVDKGIEVKVKDYSGNVVFAGKTEEFIDFCGADNG